jgi:hypothetical protein
MESGHGESALEIACKFYGLEIEHIPRVAFENNDQIINFFNKKNLRAIVIDASSLRISDKTEQSSIIRVFRKQNVPLLIFGIRPDTNPDILSDCSQMSITSCQNISRSAIDGYYQTENADTATRQLSGMRFPYISKNVACLYYDGENVKPIIQLYDEKSLSQFPIFVKVGVEGQEIFFLAENQLVKTSKAPRGRKTWPKKYESDSISQYDRNILQLLPFLIFLRYTCGEMCWHSCGHYSNLTIDDPWLTEPYGFFSFKGILEQMKINNFHTTIAFIAWNYDRSKPEVVDLVKRNPERFSLCLHGNNHDHMEFYRYENEFGDPWKAKSINEQEKNIKQALARMDRFHAMTGITYDKVMVFPHGIAPAGTLGLLKKYGFLATVNATIVPLGSREPSDIFFQLRPLTLKYEKFPALRRYAPNRPIADIALDLFLDNPILFYGHHDYFRNGINAFNGVVEKVNKIQPDITWQSLGYIIQHFYLERKVSDDSFEVMAFSDSFIIKNCHQRDLKYHIHKEASFSPSIKRVMVDDISHFYQRANDSIELDILLPQGESRHINIECENQPDISSIDISKKDLRINRLRGFSDYRDMRLSRSFVGRIFIRFYYQTGFYKVGIKKIVFIFIIILIASSGAVIFIIRKRRR